MPFNTNGRNAMLSGGLGNAVTHLSVHDAVPDAAGSDEIAGGSYARQAVTWDAPAGGARDNSGTITHEMPGGSTAVAYGYADALAAGAHYGHSLVGSTREGFGCVSAAGVTANSIQSAGHGLSNGNRVAVYNVHAESLPAGLAELVLYFVVGAAADTFQVSLTEGGGAVDITGQGELWWQDCVPETFGSAGQLVADPGELLLDANVV